MFLSQPGLCDLLVTADCFFSVLFTGVTAFISQSPHHTCLLVLFVLVMVTVFGVDSISTTHIVLTDLNVGAVAGGDCSGRHAWH